ncbi:MAG: ferredoxin family 2Fe-2S iron-sulfur cluster binding protein [Pseudomonadota bacterium]
MPKIIFETQEGKEVEVEAEIGLSVLEVARQYTIDLEGACEGSMACSTCHVIVVDEESYKALPPIEEAEEDMLDLVFGLTKTSRLGCQIIITEDMEGMKLRLP